jgi:NADP-dependent 3-hydroxy acid dehydrogenase YdfG
MKIFLTGSSSGIGAATKKLLATEHEVTAPTRQEFDLEDFAMVEGADFSPYDVVINCAGANMGAWQGWHNNNWHNQSRHVAVNFTAPLLMAKQYTRQRSHGHFIYVTSASADDPIAYNIFMVASKAALRYSLDTVKKQYTNFVFSEICPGKVKSNMLQQNYQGTKTLEEIEQMYKQGPCLSSQQVAETIVAALNLRLDKITIVPHSDQYN